MRALLIPTRSRPRPCPSCGATAGRFLVEELTLFETLFNGETYEIDACPCGWTQRIDEAA